MRLIIVKRGRLSTFRTLQAEFADQPGVQVIWDRRQEPDRRLDALPVPAERRTEERRRPAPESWTASHHVMLPSRSWTESTVQASSGPVRALSELPNGDELE